MKVAKFGGSSVADAGQIRKIRKIIESDPERQVVVVSAPGKRYKEDDKVTDLLYKTQAEAAAGGDYKKTFGIIRERFLGIARELKIADFMTEQLDEIEAKIGDGATADYAASRGEFLSARMIAEFLGYEFIDAREVIKLMEDGRVDESTYRLVPERLQKGTRYILPGFFGETLAGKIKTFSRGGSDITGAIAARAAGASVYENWTDVSGILTADPRIVDHPRPVKEITYREIREMASVGANVFHEEAIAPVKSQGIPINIRNTNEPEAPGTIIKPDRDALQSPVVGVAGKKGYRRVTIEKFMMNRYPGLQGKAYEFFRSRGAEPEFELKGVDTLQLFTAGPRASEEAFSAELTEAVEADSAAVDGTYAVIGVVGEGLAENRRAPGELLNALTRAEIPLLGLNFGGSPITMLFIVPEEDYIKALNSLSDIVADL